VAISFLFSLLIAVSARISFMLPVSPVPVSLQTAAVLLAGMLLGPRWGTWSVFQYICLGLLGAPVFALGQGGLGVIYQPSFGYLLGFIPACYVTGLLAFHWNQSHLKGFVAAAAGLAVIYLAGSFWLAGGFILTGMGTLPALVAAFARGVAPFVLVDSLKILLVVGIWNLRPRFGET
jgi:biotin transport system substrate-specific component